MSIPSITPVDFCHRQFDYLVVGGGTAGLVVAARLSKDPRITVGVLEAGPAAFDEPLINVPGRFGESLNTKYDWQFETIAQDGLGGRKLPWPRGKVLGGTSALNFMTWSRGNREDYDAWEELGNAGWGWESLLAEAQSRPFFKKSETLIQPSAVHQEQHNSYFNSEFHGIGGPVKTSYSLGYTDSHKHWHDTLHRLGVETNRSHFSGSNVGVWTTVTSVDPESRRRCSSATAYYLPNSWRKNLVVLTDALAREVILQHEGTCWVAKGVRFAYGGEEWVAKACQEVIVSAGSVQSPQLLELSGIGNPAILKNEGITVKIDNPNVGENLQEHMMTAMIYEILPSIITPDDLRVDAALAEAADIAYSTSQTGLRTILPCSLSYLPLSHFIPPNDLAAFASRATPAGAGTLREHILTRQFSPDKRLGQVEYIFDVGNWSPYFKSVPGKKYGTLLQILQYPFSKGSIHIPQTSSSGPTTTDDKPEIDPKYFAGEGGQIDFEVMVAAQKFADKICCTKPLSDIVVARVFPIPKHTVTGEEDFSDFVRRYTMTDWHPVGTCAMGGVAGIKEGVVDERLKVYGVKGLRVVDASIMPLQVSAHTQATVYAIGEKGASMILEDRTS
ncbi:MAG: hypothetical protein M1816_005319 [Peltula sp. TS41687]|nr:MAG: hypothetical protein M1816_005319 [Peltula sp. TS41687]